MMLGRTIERRCEAAAQRSTTRSPIALVNV
jgi:hypothetical protein